MRKREPPPESRADDPPYESHLRERVSEWAREEIEWKKAPRLLLIIGLIASMGFNTLLGTMVVGLVVDRFKMIESAGHDQLRATVADLEQRQTEQGVRLKVHDDMLQNMNRMSDRMFELQSEVRSLNERLKRKGF